VAPASSTKGQAGAALMAGTSPSPDTDPQSGTSLSSDASLRAGMGLRASLLLGVAVALRGTTVAGDRDVARIAADARDLIGAEAFASAFARGAAMRREEALTVLGGEDA
jgi:hypothetical protein